MKKCTLFSILCYCLLAATLQAQTTNLLVTKPSYQANQLLLHLQAGVAEAQQTNEVLDMLQAPTEKTQTIAGTDVLIVQIPDVLTIAGKRLTNPQAIADYFQNNPHPYIDYVEPNYLYSIDSTPNDPLYGNLWGMDKIQAPQAWDIDHDCSDVIVGVIDTGIDWKHPDLIDNIWQNLGEDADGDGRVLEYIGGTWQFDPGDINNVDNDGNGYADDFVGWDFVNNDNNPMDDHSHGTHCAGTIGARGNNNIGVVGVCWNVKLMALKFLGASGGGFTSGAVAALNYATAKGVKITNNSWGGGGYNTSLYDAIQNAQNNNALFVAAAGNNARNIDVIPFYPASYNNANIIAVASTDVNDNLSSFSNYGAISVDLGAPGSNIYSTTPNNTYDSKNGTSMATPHVAGAAALVSCPSMTYADVKAALLNNTTPLASLTGNCVTGGRLNLYNALTNTNCCNVTAAFTMPTAPFCINQPITFTNTSANATTYEWKVDNVTQSNTANFTYTFTTSGTHTVTLIATNATCSDAVMQTVNINGTADASFTHTESNLTTILTAMAGETSYSWNFGDGGTSNTQNATHTYAAAGTYNVCLTVANGCGSVNSCQNVTLNDNGNTACWQSISTGSTYTVAIKTDGTLWAWGDNFTWHFYGVTTSKNTPTQIGTANDWKSISVGNEHTIAIKTNGTLWAWGNNGKGQLGDGTTTYTFTPNQIGTATNWKSTSAGNLHTIAIKTDGTLWAWGDNYYGQLGDGTNTDKNTPTQIGTANNWQSISAGYEYTIAIKTDGTLWAWGNNGNGQLGDGTNTDKNTPTQIGSSNNWQSISAGFFHTIAIKTDGTLWAWGYNWYGQLGDGTTTTKYTPTQIGSSNNWKSTSAGSNHTIALKTDGTLWAWGGNGSGQLGDGTTTNKTTPTQISTAINWQSISAGGGHTIAIKTDGTLWAWGSNHSGQLGDGTDGMQKSPTPIGTATNWQSISAGDGHTIALKTDGTLWAWGSNWVGQLGDGTTTNKSIPTQIGTATDWQSISTGYQHTIAIKTDGTLWAWGLNNYGQLGDGTTTNKNIPTQIGTAANWQSISARNEYTIALKTDGTLWAWGRNGYGQLGDGTTINKATPTQIGTAINWQSISAGGSHTIALKTDGTLWAWGYNYYGELGDGTTIDKSIPTQIGTATNWQSISAGGWHTVALKTDGTLWAWGGNGRGQLGDGTTTNKSIPTQIGAATNWLSISAGNLHNHAIKTDGTLWAWGGNNSGELGNGTTTTNVIPAQIDAATDWQSISAGYDYTIALRTNKTLWTWGSKLWETIRNTPIQPIGGNCSAPCPVTTQFTAPTTTCKNAPTTFTNTSTSATTYQWLVDNTPVSNTTNLTHTFTTAGTHTVKLIASNGTCSNELTQTITVDGNCVWPGDANADGTVNMLDWLALGLAFDATGTPRTDQTIDYTAKQATNFATSFAGNLFTGINHKHTDTNGNGTVEITDSTAITQNYGLVHALGATPITPSNSPEVLLSTESNTPLVAQSTTASIDITIQNALNGGAISTYGMVFRVSYAGASNPQLSFAGSCLGIVGTDFIATYKNDAVAKKLYVGITRTNHTNINAYGKVATMQVTIDELPAGDPLTLTMPIDETVVNDNNGYIIPSGAGSAAMMEAYEYLSQTPAILLKAKALLQGAMTEISLDDAVMTTSFNPTIPTQQPYNVAPWNYAGTETGTIPPNAVDWVLIELRSSLNPTQIALQKAVLLLNDGSLQDIGTPIQANAVALDGLTANQSYTLTIRHRNHLSVKSSNAIAITSNVLACDFTQSATQTQGGAAQLAFVNNRYALKQLVTPIITGTTTLCNNATATYTHSNPVLGNSYTWSVTGGTIVSGQNSNNLVVQWTTGTSGTISRQDQSTLNTTVLNVTLNPAPDAIVSVGGNASGGGTPGLTSYNLCTTCKVYLKSNYTNLTTYTLKWYKNNNELTQYQNYLGGNVKKAGNYKLKVIRNSTGCEDFSQTVVITGGAPMAAYNTNPNIDNSSESAKNEEDLFETDDEMLQFQLYPNPAKGTTQLYYQLALQQTATLQITDLMGKQLQQITLSNSGTHTIDLNNYPNGIYLCQMMIDGKLISTQKLVVM